MSRSPCRNASIRAGLVVGKRAFRNPILGIFANCCASTAEHGARSTERTTRKRKYPDLLLECKTTYPKIVSSLVLQCAFLAPCPQLRATCYFMTLSARASTFGGIVRPICLAALRLITNSNFVGCSTGKSAGFVPLRILSTWTATRR